MKNTMNTSIDFWTLNTGRHTVVDSNAIFPSEDIKAEWKKIYDSLKKERSVDLGDDLQVIANKIDKSIVLSFVYSGNIMACSIGELEYDQIESRCAKIARETYTQAFEGLGMPCSKINIKKYPYVMDILFPPVMPEKGCKNVKKFFEDQTRVMLKIPVAELAFVSFFVEDWNTRKRNYA